MLTTSMQRVIVGVLVALYLGAVAITVGGSPQGWTNVASPESGTRPWWLILGPALLGCALILLLPRRAKPQPARVGDPRAFRRSTVFLLVLAVAIIGVGVAPVGIEDFILAKLLIFLILPGLALGLAWRRGVRIQWRPGAWRWWIPAGIVALWAVLSFAGPWVERVDFSDYDLGLVIVGATVTAMTAGVGEELFYRRWLQTRLEAWGGAAVGIAISTVLFALMHVGTHGTGDLLADAALFLTVHGTGGLFYALLWWRYRNIAMNIVAHLLHNGWAVGVYLVGVALG
ncbi:MAG: type II CAAX endopeptidase family protein [Micrococcus sp.]|nr:type II CAAX endopeptidase family protein [Micrococcus sp.]